MDSRGNNAACRPLPQPPIILGCAARNVSSAASACIRGAGRPAVNDGCPPASPVKRSRRGNGSRFWAAIRRPEQIPRPATEPQTRPAIGGPARDAEDGGYQIVPLLGNHRGMGEPPLTVRLATERDQAAIIALLDAAATWLRTQSTNQWAKPWRTEEDRRTRISRDLLAWQDVGRVRRCRACRHIHRRSQARPPGDPGLAGVFARRACCLRVPPHGRPQSLWTRVRRRPARLDRPGCPAALWRGVDPGRRMEH